MDDTITLRLAVPDDAAAILAVYAPYIRNTAITYEYEVPTVEEFRARIENTLRYFPYIVAEKDGKILGYAYASRFHPRAAYAWAAEMSIYLAPECRRTGLGTRLYALTEDILKTQGFLNLYACIAYTDTPDEHLDDGSVRFHEKRGYKIVGHSPKSGYKFGTWYDYIWMEKVIGKHGNTVSPTVPFSAVRDAFPL